MGFGAAANGVQARWKINGKKVTAIKKALHDRAFFAGYRLNYFSLVSL